MACRSLFWGTVGVEGAGLIGNRRFYPPWIPRTALWKRPSRRGRDLKLGMGLTNGLPEEVHLGELIAGVILGHGGCVMAELVEAAIVRDLPLFYFTLVVFVLPFQGLRPFVNLILCRGQRANLQADCSTT
jgi:hypothetical protein